MGKVQYNQKGYIGTSMSVRATRAYEAGEKPLSKFTAADKNTLNELIQKYAPETELVIQNVQQLKTIMRKWGGNLLPPHRQVRGHYRVLSPVRAL